MSLDQRPTGADVGAFVLPTQAEAMRSALGSVRAEGLEPDTFGMSLIEAVTDGELRVDEAIEQALAHPWV